MFATSGQDDYKHKAIRLQPYDETIATTNKTIVTIGQNNCRQQDKTIAAIETGIKKDEVMHMTSPPLSF